MGFTHRCVLVALTGLIYASPVRAVITKHRVQPYDILISLLFNFLMMLNFILQYYDFTIMRYYGITMGAMVTTVTMGAAL